MDDLAEFMPQQSATVERIHAAYKARGDAEPKRGYLGASVAGHECDRFLWLTFRGVIREDVEGRMYRLWQTGHREEARMLDDLRAIGCEVFDRDEKGEQFGGTELGGHYSWHADAVVTGVPEAPKTPHVAECKTHKASSFSDLVKKGVRASKPVHFAQMQLYMGGLKLDRALYLAHNKDTDELHAERVKFELAEYKRLLERAGRIIRTSKAPAKISERADDWRCKMCPAQSLCHGDAEGPAVPIRAQTCKACVHSTPETEGTGARWSCDLYMAGVGNGDVGAECPSFLLLPGLVSFAEPSDSDDGWIEFTNKADGAKWKHGTAAGQWSAKDLMTSRGPLEPQRLPMARDLPGDATVLVGGRHVAGPAPTVWAPKPDPSSPHQSLASGAASLKTHGSQTVPAGPGPATTSHSDEDVLCGCDDLPAPHDEREPHPPIRIPTPGQVAVVSQAAEAILAVDLGDLPLLARYPWADSEKLWDGPSDELVRAIADMTGVAPNFLPEPRATQDDESVNASEHRIGESDYLLVHYKADAHAAIWRGKS